MSNNTAGAATRTGRRDVNRALFLTAMFVAAFGFMNANLMVAALLVEIATAMSISVALAGQLTTATYAASVVSVLSSGPLSDSFGRRPVAIAGMLLVAGSLVGSAFAPNFAALLALRALTGLGAGAMPPTMAAAISDVISPARQGRAMGAVLAVGMMTSVVSVPAIAVLADLTGWRFTFIVSGLLGGAGLVANWLWMPKDSRGQVWEIAIFSRYWNLISLGFFRAALTVNLAHRIAFWAVVSFFPAYIIHAYDVSLRSVALPVAIVAIGQVAGSYAGGYVAGSRRRVALIVAAGASGGAGGFLCFALDLGLWTAVALATVGTGLLSVIFPALMAASIPHAGKSRATGAGMVGLSNQMGGVLGAAIAGGLLASAGYAGIAYLCLGAVAVSMVTALLFARQLRPEARQD